MTISPLLETAGVIILAILGIHLGRRAAKAGFAFQLLAFLIPFILATMIAIPRWFPQLEFVAPFRWIMDDRREYALLALVCTLLLTPPLSKLPHKRQRIMVFLFMVVFVFVYSVLPFLLPGLNHSYLNNLETKIDANGICMQSNGYNCGPAAAVTALHQLGVAAKEGELAILSHTTSLAGTPADSLCKAINRRYRNDGIFSEYKSFPSVSALRDQTPVIAVVKYGFLVDHYVTVLRVSDTNIQVGDPLEGQQTLTHSEFDAKWRKCGIVVRKITNPSIQTPETVRVAAIQCASEMGKTAENIHNITNLVKKAASMGARIIVLPECAIQGYLDPETWTSWSATGPGKRDVQRIAEAIPGPITDLFAHLANELKIYLCIGMIEASSNAFFNSQVLLSPTGSIAAHHRKKSLWTPGDSSWCTPGNLPVQVVKTPYGNLGLMICYDFHSLPPLLAKHAADIILYSVGWYGPNEANWFGKVFPQKAVIPYGFDVIAANWSSPTAAQEWPGRGHSCIIKKDGKIIAMSELVCGNDIVLGDLEIRKR